MYTAAMFRMPKPDDFHVHLRQGPAMAAYARDHAAVFGRGLIMPNTLPPVRDAKGVTQYKSAIQAAAKPVNPDYQALMTFKLFPSRTLGDLGNLSDYIDSLKKSGAVAAKLYPAGVTTNSSDGVTDIEELYPILEHMQDAGLVLCVHGEEPGAFCLDREAEFLPKLNRIVCDFPRLRLVLEHVSSAAACEWISNQPERIGATVTVQHLLYSLDDMLGDHLQPHLFCKPLLKRPSDRLAIQKAVLAGNPRFFFGSDSAPHQKVAKESDCGAAGVYSAPVALSLLAEFFESAGKPQLLSDFIARLGADFYQLAQNPQEINLVKRAWRVPEALHDGEDGFEPGGVVPLAAGRELAWSIE